MHVCLVPTDRVFHYVCKGVPDSNLVYPLSSTLCLPAPVAVTARFSGLDPTPVTTMTTASKHVQVTIAWHGGLMHHTCVHGYMQHTLFCGVIRLIIIVFVVYNYVCECTVGVDVGDGPTILL